MIERYGVYFGLAGIALLAVGWLWTVVRAFRNRRGWGLFVLLCPPSAPFYALWKLASTRGPLIVLCLGMLAVLAPAGSNLVAPVDLGPRDAMVAGERHLTLTGWDRRDYSTLAERADAVVLQMANPDVTDATLAYLEAFDHLKELDLSDSRITDVGLKRLAALPALATLRLRNTPITDAGFRAALADKESLLRIDLTGTAVDRETVDAWRKARPGRRAMQ